MSEIRSELFVNDYWLLEKNSEKDELIKTKGHM